METESCPRRISFEDKDWEIFRMNGDLMALRRADQMLVRAAVDWKTREILVEVPFSSSSFSSSSTDMALVDRGALLTKPYVIVAQTKEHVSMTGPLFLQSDQEDYVLRYEGSSLVTFPEPEMYLPSFALDIRLFAAAPGLPGDMDCHKWGKELAGALQRHLAEERPQHHHHHRSKDEDKEKEKEKEIACPTSPAQALVIRTGRWRAIPYDDLGRPMCGVVLSVSIRGSLPRMSEEGTLHVPVEWALWRRKASAMTLLGNLQFRLVQIIGHSTDGAKREQVAMVTAEVRIPAAMVP